MKKILVFSILAISVFVFFHKPSRTTTAALPITDTTERTCYPFGQKESIVAEHYVITSDIRHRLEKGAKLENIGYSRQSAEEMAEGLKGAISFWQDVNEKCDILSEKKVISSYVGSMLYVKDKLEIFLKRTDI